DGTAVGLYNQYFPAGNRGTVVKNYAAIWGALEKETIMHSPGGFSCATYDNPYAMTRDGNTHVMVCSSFDGLTRMPVGSAAPSKANVAIHEAAHMLIGPDLRDQSSRACSG